MIEQHLKTLGRSLLLALTASAIMLAIALSFASQAHAQALPPVPPNIAELRWDAPTHWMDDTPMPSNAIIGFELGKLQQDGITIRIAGSPAAHVRSWQAGPLWAGPNTYFLRVITCDTDTRPCPETSRGVSQWSEPFTKTNIRVSRTPILEGR